MVYVCLEAAQHLAEEGIDVEVIVRSDEQQKILTAPASQPSASSSAIAVCHEILTIRCGSCRTTLTWHLTAFGMPGMSDEMRASSLVKLIDAGCASRLMVSHDSVWYWVDSPTIGARAYKSRGLTNFLNELSQCSDITA